MPVYIITANRDTRPSYLLPVLNLMRRFVRNRDFQRLAHFAE